jgi:Fic family protein
MNIIELEKYLLTLSIPVSISDILTIKPTLVRRTLQRWLIKLQDENKVIAVGEGRGRKYIAVHKLSDLDTFPKYIPLSLDSIDVLDYLDRPMASRDPVGYNYDFLAEYKTYYLSEPIRRQLHRMGRTSMQTQAAGTYGRDIYNRLLIDLSWASSHLEGNTYSKLDTIELIEHGHYADGKALIETQMILNHKAAIEMLIDSIDEVKFNRFTLLNIHSTLSENLLPNPFDEGRVRSHIVEIGGSTYKPIASEEILNIQLDIILEKSAKIEDPFEQSFFIMVHLPYLQPFADVNKRTSRLAANIPLLKENLCPLTFLDVPAQAYSRAILGVYEMNRVELLRDLYLWAYERSTKEYIAVKQALVKPDLQRLEYRQITKQIVKDVVLQYKESALEIINSAIEGRNVGEQNIISTLVLEELRRLHEGVLVRYGLRPSQFKLWKQAHK